MADARKEQTQKSMIKIVYFDEQSASDYLDISAGGKAVSTSEDVRKRTADLHGKVAAELTAKLSWLPFLGGSATAGAGVDVSRVGQSILSKTLSNTILTDYLEEVAEDSRVERLHGLKVTAPQASMAFMKMYTPYMIIAKSEESEVDLARLDEALEAAKGYYELLGEDMDGKKSVLRFNIKAFRNNYGLTDLSRMRLVFHGVQVGRSAEASLNFKVEMERDAETESVSALDLLDGTATQKETLLDVYDVILAGVEHGG